MNHVALCRGTILLLIGATTPMSALIGGSSQAKAQQATYDVVLIGGTVVDPETNLQAVRNVAISGSKIAMVSTTPLRGRTTVNAKGLVVAPGFIDIHVHGQSIPTDWLSAFDGVTTAVETEAGRYRPAWAMPPVTSAGVRSTTGLARPGQLPGGRLRRDLCRTAPSSICFWR